MKTEWSGMIIMEDFDVHSNRYCYNNVNGAEKH